MNKTPHPLQTRTRSVRSHAASSLQIPQIRGGSERRELQRLRVHPKPLQLLAAQSGRVLGFGPLLSNLWKKRTSGPSARTFPSQPCGARIMISFYGLRK